MPLHVKRQRKVGHAKKRHLRDEGQHERGSALETLSQPHFGLNVRVKPTLPKVGSWSPPGLPKTQSANAGVKSPHIWALLVSLERS